MTDNVNLSLQPLVQNASGHSNSLDFVIFT